MYEVVGWGVMIGDEKCEFCGDGAACCYISDSVVVEMKPACPKCRDEKAPVDKVEQAFHKALQHTSLNEFMDAFEAEQEPPDILSST